MPSNPDLERARYEVERLKTFGHGVACRHAETGEPDVKGCNLCRAVERLRVLEGADAAE